jgi:small subunit ribosomal protein S6
MSDPMRNYEITFIVDPVLSGEEIKATAQTYVDLLTTGGCKIVHVNEMGLRQLAYPINKRTSGVYYCIEFEVENGEIIANLELALRRDERIMRFLSVKLDKYGVKYNEDKRNGLIGTVKKKPKKSDKDNKRDNRDRRRDNRNRPPRQERAPKAEEKKTEEKSSNEAGE